MEKQQIIDYVMDSPENTNPAILGQMIDEMSGSTSNQIFITTCTTDKDSHLVLSHTLGQLKEILNNNRLVFVIDLTYVDDPDIMRRGYSIIEQYNYDSTSEEYEFYTTFGTFHAINDSDYPYST